MIRVLDLQRRAPVLQLVALVVLFVYGVATIDGFGAESTIDSMLVLAALLGIAALGQTLVLILGGIDFSVVRNRIRRRRDNARISSMRRPSARNARSHTSENVF